MKIAIIGQQDFGKAVLDAFLARGDEVAGVFCAPEKPGAKADPIKAAAEERKLKVFQFKSLRGAEAHEALSGLKVDLGIMAYVLQFAPREFVAIPKHGTIQYHPSLLPKHRGPSSINWPIIQGATRTGLTIFRPNDGLDEGPVMLQKECDIGPDDTIGSVYFDKLFPMGIKAMLEAADLVVAGEHKEVVQDESRATYEGWCRSAEAKIDWAKPIDQVYNLIRGCNPAPGAWTTANGRKVQIFDARRIVFRRFADVVGKLGEVSDVTEASFKVTAQGGIVEVLRARGEDGKKVSGGEFARANGLSNGAIFGG
ncbi:MAG: methionyl-tRNA formyltransferase [Betaproteobacteria bacterium RIFCSPLOWO2_12_FULL_62_58]|nr:MAG: methionyl-tRNA formyltransferase [Betaproteobacteria bacterium RIFCSPLOWO2_12_FULL_62_58]